jgi:hypothetical protein
MSVRSDGQRSSPQGSSSRPWSGMPGPCCIAVRHSQGEARLDDLWVRPGWFADDGAEAATHCCRRSMSSTSTQGSRSSTLTWPRGAMPAGSSRSPASSWISVHRPLWASDGDRKRHADCPFPVHPSPVPYPATPLTYLSLILADFPEGSRKGFRPPGESSKGALGRKTPSSAASVMQSVFPLDYVSARCGGVSVHLSRTCSLGPKQKTGSQ